jgi:hypothetical protein
MGDAGQALRPQAAGRIEQDSERRLTVFSPFRGFRRFSQDAKCLIWLETRLGPKPPV